MKDEKGWLPPPLNEYPTICLQIQIPDNIEYKAAFYGALAELGKGYNWQVGGDEAREQAISAYWNRLIFDEITDDCEGGAVATQFRFTEACGLEYSADGVEWTPVSGWDDFAAACFEGPAGPAGETGPAGPAGETGPAGPTAPAGETAPIVPPSGNGVDDACTVATAVVNSVLDNYVLPSLDIYVDEIIALGMSQLETQRELLEVGSGGAISSGLSALWGNVTQALYSAGVAIGATIHASILTFSAWLWSMDAVAADTARDDLRTQAVRDELICILFGCLGRSTNLTQAVVDCWTAGVAASTAITQEARDALLTYIADHLPLYALRMEAVYHSDTVGNCNRCVADHYYEWDFTTSRGDWFLQNAEGQTGHWTDGVGYEADLRITGADRTDELRLNRTFTTDFSRKLVRIEVDAEFFRGQIQYGGVGRGDFVVSDPNAASLLFFRNVSFDGREAVDQDSFFRNYMRIVAIASQRTSNVPNPRGRITLRGIKVWYNGADANFTGGTGF